MILIPCCHLVGLSPGLMYVWITHWNLNAQLINFDSITKGEWSCSFLIIQLINSGRWACFFSRHSRSGLTNIQFCGIWKIQSLYLNSVLETKHRLRYKPKLGYGLFSCWIQVVMLLKRNLRQITYLHLYHHASICCVWWIIAHLCPTGDGEPLELFYFHILPRDRTELPQPRSGNAIWVIRLSRFQRFPHNLFMCCSHACVNVSFWSPWPK